ncbi:DUF6582 domain-containing protein [Deinococcus altitudinis]|uniref:DUF6582 domain-containing protein n=1 Tax=Deinococcus altitudinis TaxID=468914 RepID=UPI003891C071
MADLSIQQRDDLKDTDFAYVDKQGERHLPIHDEEHVRNAAARFSQTHFESTEARHKAAKHVLAAAKKLKVDIAEDDAVSKAAKSGA